MPWCRPSSFALPLALVASVLASPAASAQEAPAAPTPAAPSTPAAAATEASPQRPPLISPTPKAAPAPADSAAIAVINPTRDQQALAAQGAQRPDGGELATGSSEVFSEDWWGHARPVVELHGMFRTRAELFHNFSLGRINSSFQSNDPQYLWPVPLDQSYTPLSMYGSGATVALCGSATPLPNGTCSDKTEASANLRFRLDPEIHISDNLRILSQIDALDNLVLGSTPNSYANQPATQPSANGMKVPSGYTSAGYNAYAPLGFFATTQGPPTAVNAPRAFNCSPSSWPNIRLASGSTFSLEKKMEWPLNRSLKPCSWPSYSHLSRNESGTES